MPSDVRPTLRSQGLTGPSGRNWPADAARGSGRGVVSVSAAVDHGLHFQTGVMEATPDSVRLDAEHASDLRRAESLHREAKYLALALGQFAQHVGHVGDLRVRYHLVFGAGKCAAKARTKRAAAGMGFEVRQRQGQSVP